VSDAGSGGDANKERYDVALGQVIGRHPGRAWAAGLLLVAMTAVVYVPATQCGFIWDDDSYVVDNQTLREPDGLRRIWFQIGATTQYYPLVYTTYWMEYRLWELDPTGYHVINILLHALAAVLLWRVLTVLGVPGAWVAAALFALHPVQVQSVAWITQRKNVLSGILYLGAALAYLRYALVPTIGAVGTAVSAVTAGGAHRPTEHRSQDSGTRAGLYLLALVLFLGALLSKTVTCTLPVVLLFVLWWKRRRLSWQDVYSLTPFLLLGIAFGFLTIWVENNQVRAVGAEWDRPFVDRCLVAGHVLWFYLGKLIWPHQLTFVYPRWQIDAQDVQQYLYPLAAIIGLAVLWLLRRRIGKGPVVAALCFGVTLFPALGFFNIYYTRYAYVADQWQYLGGIFAIALVAAVGRGFADRLGGWARGTAAVLAAVVLVTLGTLSYRCERAYTDLESIWLDTLGKNPDCWLAHNNLGNLYESEGRLDEAVRQHNQALEGGSHFDTDIARSHFNLGNVLVLQDKLEEAISHYRKSVQVQPEVADAHVNLANALRKQGKVVEAIRHYGMALEFRPEDPAIHYNVAMVLTMIGQTETGVEHLRETVRLAPDWLAPLSGLAWILASDPDEDMRDPDEAIRLAEHAAELTERKNGAVLDLLAAAYAAAGQFERAVATAEEALDLASASQADRLADVIRARLELYRQGTPFLKPARVQD
jgi:tetratricopeptide (TPR) repeat protein